MDLFFENCSSSPDGLRSELILPTWVQQVVAMWIACSPYRHSRINVHLSWSASLKCMYEQLAVAFALACAAQVPDNNMAGNTVRHTATAGRRNRGLGKIWVARKVFPLTGFTGDAEVRRGGAGSTVAALASAGGEEDEYYLLKEELPETAAWPMEVCRWLSSLVLLCRF
jgi:hypothetical protein